MEFKKVLAVVLSVFGLDVLPKKDGKSILTEDMKKQLQEKWGEKFVSTFEKDLAEFEKKGNDQGADSETADLKRKFEDMKTKFEQSEKDKSDLQVKFDKLLKDPEADNAEEIPVGNAGKRPAFKADMSYMHNKVLDNYFNGDASMMYSTDETIETSELQKEFGKYISSERIDILRRLTNDLTCTDYMTTIVTDKTEWRASQAIIDSVLQQFTPFWTPSKGTKFTPITIKNFFLKVNVPIKPADIIEDYIGYLYDENLSPEQMPIVKYIVNELVLPKLSEDLEDAMATGKFIEAKPTKDGEDASPAGDSMDGFVTILKKLKSEGKEIGAWLLPDVAKLTRANILEKVENAVDSVASKYKKKKMFIHADPDIILLYNRAYQDKYPNTKNVDKDNMQVDFTKFTWAPVDGMQGSGAFFLTPKENFKHLMSKNHREAKIYMQVQNYDVKVFMEFRKGTGFAMQEAIFAYLPEEAAGENEEGI